MIFTTARFLVSVVSGRHARRSFCLYSSLGVVSKAHSVKMSGSGMVVERFDNIIKSSEDKRSYRGVILKNRLKVLLVSDPTTDKSAAAMDVNVGYLSDPDEIPGLAHFCEHMLFLGTKEYPNEDDYQKFLAQHGGGSNAATYPDHTSFYFDIVPEHLKGALHRFSQFFICPLFTASATDRELNAVNSEHDKNIHSDAWRMEMLERHTANRDHPYHKFGTGNKQTLETIPKEKGMSVREELLKFHGKWYSSNIMSLAVLGKESLDELEEMIVELFSTIEDKDTALPVWTNHPFTQEQFKICTYMVPIKDIRNLNIVFPCPDLHDHYKANPCYYISNLIGHEGPGSLLAHLKELGWSNNLYAGYRSSNRGTAFFGISLDLTEEGVNHTDEIITLVFQYINMLKKEGPLEWLHNEQKHLSAMSFRFKDKESSTSYISGIVHNVQEYPMEDVLCNNYIITEWEPDTIKRLLNDFNPDNIRTCIVSKKFESKADMTEPWYGTQYKSIPISESTLQKWKNAGYCDKLRIPDKNDFIPENFEIYPLDKDITEHPAIIKDTAITRVWFKQDDTFLLPKAKLMFDFVSPLAYLDPLNCNLTRMFTQLFKDALNQYTYSAELAGLKWDLANTKYGLILSIGGFNDKQDIFLEKIMEKLTNFKIDPKRFEIYKENYIRTLKNFSAEQPYQQAVYFLAVLLTEHSWNKSELLAAMEEVTIDKLEAFIPQVLSKMHIECMIHGNVNKSKALQLVDIVEGKLCSKMNMSPLLPSQLLLNREVKLENSCNYAYEVENDVHKSSCIEIYYQCGLQTSESNILLELFAKIIQEPCFNVLRTKEQLGYIVFSGIRRSSGVQGVRVIVQSDRHPQYVDGRIEEFLKGMLTYIHDMSDEEFQKHKDALAAQRLEKPKKLSTQSFMFWSEITSQQYHFDRAKVEVAHLHNITKDDVLNLYWEMLDGNAKHRRKISVRVISTAEGGAGKLDNNISISTPYQLIRDVTVFKSAHGMYPLVQPYMKIQRKGNMSKL